jgi:hypothetical protein
MNKTLRMICAVICAVFVAGISTLIARHFGHNIGLTSSPPGSISTAQSKSKKPAAEPTAFEDCDDDDKDSSCLFDNPVPLPDNVLDALRATAEAKEMQNQLKDYDRDDFAYLFKAVVIHLGSPEEIDYVVMGEFPMGGADAPWFWIVRSDQTHPKVIFFTNSNGFALQKTRNNGYPNIQSDWCSAAECITRIYHYNGQRYILVHEYHKEINPEP